MNSFINTFLNRFPMIIESLVNHLSLTLFSLFLATLISLPLGIFLTRNQKISDFIIGLVSIFQTIPSLALLGFLIPLFGIGKTPAIFALTIYGLLPILRNTFLGILNVDPSLKEAAKGIGMTNFQILFKVEMPLALSVIMGGIRTATVLIVGVATLASLVGAGGFGDLIFRGISTVNTNLILSGAIPAALLALFFDQSLKSIEELMLPKGLKK